MGPVFNVRSTTREIHKLHHLGALPKRPARSFVLPVPSDPMVGLASCVRPENTNQTLAQLRARMHVRSTQIRILGARPCPTVSATRAILGQTELHVRPVCLASTSRLQARLLATSVRQEHIHRSWPLTCRARVCFAQKIPTRRRAAEH